MSMKNDKIKENIKKLIEANKIEYAKEILYSYKNMEPEDIEIYSMEAVLFIMENEIDKAISVLEYAIDINIKNFDVFYNLGYCFEITGDIKNAVRNYRKSWFYLDDQISEKELLIKIYSLEYNCNDYDELLGIYTYYNQVKEFTLMRLLGNTEVRFEDVVTQEQTKLKRNIKVLFAPIEIANQMNTYSVALNDNGIDAYTLNEYESYLQYKSDFSLPPQSISGKKLDKIAYIIGEFDIFHLFFGQSIFPDRRDLDVLNELNKKIVMNYWGSEIRIKSIAEKNNKYARVKCHDEKMIEENLKFFADKINTCIVTDNELYQYVKEYYKNIEFLSAGIELINSDGIDIDDITNKDSITIVHAPTSPYYKGSEFIVKAIEKLKKKYDIEFILVEGMANDEAKKIYKKADLIIDQILCGTHGIFAIEAMSMGKPVITYISENYKDSYPDEIPIISANPDNIEKVIEECIVNRDILKKAAISGIDYVKKYHSTAVISKNLMRIYKKL